MPKKPDSKTPKMSPLLGSSKPSGKKGGRGDMSESDDSVDSNGDLRGFIDNDYDTNSDSSYYSESDSPGIKNNKKKGRRPRKAAILASKRIRNQIKMENSSSEKRSKTNSTLQSPNRRKSSRVDMEDDTNSDDENAKLLQQVIKAIQQQAISSKSEKKNNKNQVMRKQTILMRNWTMIHLVAMVH
jgi:hypothetical protein